MALLTFFSAIEPTVRAGHGEFCLRTRFAKAPLAGVIVIDSLEAEIIGSTSHDALRSDWMPHG